MTPRQRRFANGYDGNATQAAKDAGYSEKTAYSIGQRLLKNVEISAAIAKRENATAAKCGLSQEWVLDRLRENAERALQAQQATNEEGQPVGEFYYEGSVANRALELLGKHLGMFPDRVVVDDPAKLSDEELAAKTDDARRKLKLA